MLLYAWNEPALQDRVTLGEAESAPSLDALLALLLIKFLQQRMRIGLGRGYMQASKRTRTVKGRINFTESLKQQTFERGEAVCDFQEYSIDEPRNQIIRSTLARLVQTAEFGPDPADADALRQRLRWLVRNLDGVEMIELSPELFRRQLAAQNENDYRLMLSICELLFLRQMPLQKEGTHPLPRLEHDALVLHRIYERFVANFYRIRLQGWDVLAQTRLDWHARHVNEHLPAMIPDLVLHEPARGGIIILDTKFTAASLVWNQWGKPLYDSSHLYQLYAYLRSQEHLSQEYRHAVGILLYPAIQARLSEKIELPEHDMRIESVDLAASWQEVERQLLEIVH
jgi:5-methylcytosine-specific restriction enzyme subunit McrC